MYRWESRNRAWWLSTAFSNQHKWSVAIKVSPKLSIVLGIRHVRYVVPLYRLYMRSKWSKTMKEFFPLKGLLGILRALSHSSWRWPHTARHTIAIHRFSTTQLTFGIAYQQWSFPSFKLDPLVTQPSANTALPFLLYLHTILPKEKNCYIPFHWNRYVDPLIKHLTNNRNNDRLHSINYSLTSLTEFNRLRGS